MVRGIIIFGLWFFTLVHGVAADRTFAVDGTWLVSQSVRIDERTITSADIAAWGKLKAKASAEDQALLQLLKERHARVHLGNTEHALVATISTLPSTWRAAEFPKNLQIPATGDVWPKIGLQSPTGWNLTRTQLIQVIALSRTLIGAGRADQALFIADTAKPLIESDPVAYAWVATVAAQAFIATNHAERAMQVAEHGLGRLEFKSASTYTETPPAEPGPSNQVALVRYDLIRLRDQAKRIWDEERYGPGFVRYRDAEWQRRVAHNEAEAWQLYARICTDFPGTIYAEAAEAYGISCLVAFAGDAYRQRLLDRMAAVTTRVQALYNAATEMSVAGATPAAIEEQRALLKEQQSLAAIYAALPATGPQAAEIATVAAKAFIARDPYGLYRGEAMLALGDIQFEVLLRPHDGLAWYRQAREWFETILITDAAVESFDIDPRTTSVAAPPPAMRTKDDWGNFAWTEDSPGTIINHRTCAWYVDYYRLQAALREMSCALLTGDAAMAKNLLPLIGKADPFQQELAAKGWPTLMRRLQDDISEGRLFATRNELAAFPPSMQPRLMVAELAYETERYADAHRMYESMLRDFGDRIPSNAKAYLLFHRASKTITINRQDAIRQFNAIAEDFPRAPSWSRVKFCLFSYTQTLDDDGGGALAHLDEIMKKMPGSNEAERAMFVKADFLHSRGRIDEARVLCKKLIVISDNRLVQQAARRMSDQWSSPDQ